MSSVHPCGIIFISIHKHSGYTTIQHHGGKRSDKGHKEWISDQADSLVTGTSMLLDLLMLGDADPNEISRMYLLAI